MKLTYHLHSNQGIVYLSESRFNVLAAGRRFGKTILALVKLVVFALSHNESYLWYVAPTYRQAKTIAWRLLKKIAPEVEFKTKPNESELQICFRNGSIIELKGADNEDSLRGSGLNGLVVDEFATIYNNWAVWYEVLRPALSDKLGWALFISTPKGKDAFFELFLKGQRHEDGFSSFQFRTEDNPYIDKAEVEAARKELPDRFFKQEYEASFEDYIGLVYPEFNPVHIVEPFYIPEIYKRIGSIDPAISGTTAALKCSIDEDGCLIFYEEYYEKNQRVSEVSSVIRQPNVRWWIDPSSKAKLSQKEGKLYSIYDEYTDNGIVCYPGENDVDAGLNRVGEYFKNNKIKIFSTCTKLIWELERYHFAGQRASLRGSTKATPYKKDDHLCLVGDTKILMADGTEKKIKNVMVGENVKTSQGSQKVIASSLTNESAKVSMVTFSNGKYLIGTDNHPIYTRKGKKTIDSLRYGDIIETCENLLYTRTKSIIGMESITRRLVDALMDARDFMLLFGKNLMGMFQKDVVSITGTANDGIIVSKISNSLHRKSTCQYMLKNDLMMLDSKNRIRNILNVSDHLLKRGTLVKWEGNGIVGMEKKYGLTVSQLKKDVLNVLKTFLAKMGLVNIVQENVKLDIEEKVYNLTVQNAHNYYANGILVSNCDCLRYIVMSRMSKTDFDDIELNPNSAWGKAQLLKKKREEYVH